MCMYSFFPSTHCSHSVFGILDNLKHQAHISLFPIYISRGSAEQRSGSVLRVLEWFLSLAQGSFSSLVCAQLAAFKQNPFKALWCPLWDPRGTLYTKSHLILPVKFLKGWPGGLGCLKAPLPVTMRTSQECLGSVGALAYVGLTLRQPILNPNRSINL